MSRFDDDDDEMARRELDDDAVESLLAGRTVPPGWGPVSAFVVEARSAGRGEPPAPSPELQAILTEGLSLAPDADVTPPRALRGDRAGSPGPVRRRRRMAIAELVTGLGLGAKVLLGAGVASASLTAASAAGVLPGPLDHAVAGAVRTATPFDISDDDAPATDGDGNFGSIVSDDARGDDGTPGVDGQTVASEARQHGRDHNASTTTTASTIEPTTTTTMGDDDAHGASGSTPAGTAPGSGDHPGAGGGPR